jgi:hypothetical protein
LTNVRLAPSAPTKRIRRKEFVVKTPNELRKNQSFLRDVFMFIAHNKKWYLIPVVVAILLMGVLIILGSTGAAPFVYTLF